MPPTRLRVFLIVAVVAGPVAAQPPPVAVLGEPGGLPPLFDLSDPLAPLGPPDTPFRPFAPLGPPPALADEGIGTRFGLGVPFFLKYRFLPQWTAEAVYVPIRTVSARVTWQSVEQPGFQAYGAFAWANEAYFLSGRVDNAERFYSFEKRLGGGLQFDLPYRLRLDLSAGYVFDRLYFQGKQFQDRNRDRINVGSGLFGAIQLRLQF